MSRQILRPYQLEAIERVRDAMRRRVRRILLVIPTGGGKTSCAAEILHAAVAKGSRCMFLAHRRELIDQCSRRLDDWDLPHGVIQREHWKTDRSARVQVASIQSLKNRDAAPPDLLVVDEAHRSLSKSYLDVFERFPNAVVLGLTATPIRTDGRGLGDIYREMVAVCDPMELINAGFLVMPTIFGTRIQADLSSAATSGGDYVAAAIGKIMSDSAIIGDVVSEHGRIVGRGRRTVVFACTVEHSQKLTEAFNAAGVSARHIDGGTDVSYRDDSLRALKDGAIEVIVNCQILTEGWDLPVLDAISIARPTKSLSLYLQMAGRCLRPYPGKTRAIIVDHGQTVARFGWPTEARPWSLDATKLKLNEPSNKQCPHCGMVNPPGSMECQGCGKSLRVCKKCGAPVDIGTIECPECHAPLTRIIRHLSGELEELAPETGALLDLANDARAASQGVSHLGVPIWAARAFRDAHGRWPTRDERHAVSKIRST